MDKPSLSLTEAYTPAPSPPPVFPFFLFLLLWDAVLLCVLSHGDPSRALACTLGYGVHPWAQLCFFVSPMLSPSSPGEIGRCLC